MSYTCNIYDMKGSQILMRRGPADMIIDKDDIVYFCRKGCCIQIHKERRDNEFEF